MVKGGDTPAAPDPAVTIPLQQKANLETYDQMLGDSRADQYTPFGSSTWSESDDGKWTNNVNLSAEQQSLYDKGLAGQNQMADLLQGAGDRVKTGLEAPTDFSPEARDASRQKIEDALYARQLRLANPQMEDAMRARNDQLQQSGFSINNDAYDKSIGALTQSQDEIRGGARDRAILAGGAEDDRVLNQMIQLRQMPMNELNALRTGTQITQPGTESQFSTPNLANTDVLGAYDSKYQGELDAYNADTSSGNALLGGLFGLATAPMTGGTSLFGMGAKKLFG